MKINGLKGTRRCRNIENAVKVGYKNCQMIEMEQGASNKVL